MKIQCKRIAGQIGPMLRRSYRVKLLPHPDFLGGCINSKCAYRGKIFRQSRDRRMCKCNSGLKFLQLRCASPFCWKSPWQLVDSSRGLFYPQTFGWSRFTIPKRSSSQNCQEVSFYEGPKRLNLEIALCLAFSNPFLRQFPNFQVLQIPKVEVRIGKDSQNFPS